MAPTYSSLLQQINELQKTAEAQHAKEKRAALANVRALVAEWKFKPEDVFPELAKRLRAVETSPRRDVAARQSIESSPNLLAPGADGTDPTCGGVGRRPHWLELAMAAEHGSRLAVGAVSDQGCNPEAKPAASSAAASQAGKEPRYRDEKGNTWSGRGLQPNWVNDALAAGRKLEDLRVK